MFIGPDPGQRSAESPTRSPAVRPMPAPFSSALLSANRDRKETEMHHEIHPPKLLRHHEPEAGAVLVRPVALEDE